ncbi:hypothetical protein KKF91_03640 [Myxococcota bacterium]|nr:hypothetical protein [Myxococcota bacterium]MBU1429635.1 hypothetical protein [Myxococcota bacterium]MBU1899724.1 hypothetical protein [Myxococcota bacterium]
MTKISAGTETSMINGESTSRIFKGTTSREMIQKPTRPTAKISVMAWKVAKKRSMGALGA